MGRMNGRAKRSRREEGDWTRAESIAVRAEWEVEVEGFGGGGSDETVR